MNFSWVIPDQLAGSMGPVKRAELIYLKERGIGALVRLEWRTISGGEEGLVDLAEPVPDSQAPTFPQIDRIIGFIGDRISEGVAVAVSCRAGIGRTGTVLACYLVHTGHTAQDAMEQVRSLRPGSVESPAQRDFVYLYEERLRETSG